MILVYSSKITSRLRYTLDLLFNNLLGIPFELTSDPEVYLNFKGAILNYSLKEIREKELQIFPSGFLEMRGMQPIVPEIKKIKGFPCLFPARRQGDSLGFDPFSASFYMVSRYEEYLPFRRDQYGRFEAAQSFAYKNGILEIPVVNHYALMVKKALLEYFPFLEFSSHSYSFYPTYDVDVAYAYRGRGGLRSIAGTLNSLLQGDLKGMIRRWKVMLLKEPDPFDTYGLQLQIQKKYGLKAFYFFLCGDYGPYDKNVSFFSQVFQKLVKKIGDYAFIGIHPSYLAFDDDHRLSEEIHRLGNILNREVRLSRQHYLRLGFPKTYRNLLKYDIKYDFSMGFASKPGFRAGICSPFYFYDLEKEVVTNLKIFPFTVMDVTLRDYLDLNHQQALEKISKLINEVKKVNGVFIPLWHNESLCECGKWKGWRKVYEQMVIMALPNKESNDQISDPRPD